MRNILYFIIIILVVGLAASYSLNLYTGKKLTDSPVTIVEEKPRQPEEKPLKNTPMQPAAVSGIPDADVHTHLNAMETNINMKLGQISESSDKKEVLARIDQLSKEIESDVTLMLSAVNKKEQWYRNEFYQVLAAVGAVFILLTSIILMVFISLKKMILTGRIQVSEHDEIYSSEPAETTPPPAPMKAEKAEQDNENPVLKAVSAVSSALAEKIAENKYLFDPAKAVKLSTQQKTALTEITDDIIFLDKAGIKPTPEEYYLLGLERFAEKDFSESAALFDHVKKSDGYFSAAWFMCGYIDYSAKKYEQSYENLAKACTLEADNLFYLNILSNTCLKLEKYAEAADAFKKASEIKPDFHEALHNLGLALSRLKNYDEAAVAFEKAVQVKPDKHESMYNAACVYALCGKSEEALNSLKKAVALSSEYAAKAKNDRDFDGLADNPEFKEITG